MPSILVLRFADSSPGFAAADVDVPDVSVPDISAPDIAPRWLLGAATAICGSAGDGPSGREPFSVGQRPGATWRLGWLDDDAPPPNWPPAEVRFGSRARAVAGAETHRQSYGELARGLPVRRVRLTMTTPTFFTRDGHDLPLPDPALIVRGLLVRWNGYAPAPLRIGAGDARTLVGAVGLAGLWGASADVELGHGLRQTGFVGEAELRLLAGTSDYLATMFTALARFAAYAGLGERTAYGFGAVDVDLALVTELAGMPVPRPARPATTAAPARAAAHW